MLKDKLKGVILDMDGTLVDSNPAHAQSWLQALQEVGHPADPETIRRAIGMGGDKIIATHTPWTDEDPEGKALSERRASIFRENYLPKLNAFRGAREFVERLHDQGLKLAVASSAQDQELEPLLELVGIGPFLDEQTSSSDAEESKPDPDIVAAALERLGLKPDEVVMVGDTPYDLEAAGQLGIASVAFLTGGWSRDELGGAQRIYEGPAHLLELLKSTPLEKLL